MQAQHRNRRFLLPLGILLLAWGVAGAGDWPRFRGPNGSGITTDKEVPVKWKADNILWKTPIPGVGHSSPVVSRGRVFLQSASEDGAQRWLLCLNAINGKLLWTRGVTAKKAHTHPLNSLASSTPALGADKVFAIYWDGKDMHLSAYDFEGVPQWDKNLGSFKSQHGVGHSPMLVDDKVIVANDQDGSAHLLAFNARTGAKAWETQRKPFRACYSTPFVHVQPGGAKELIVASTAGVTGYNLADGKPNWWYTWSFPGMPLRTVASPIAANGLIFTNCGDGSGERHLFAVKLGGKGDITGKNLAWENAKRRDCPYVPCLLAKGDHLYSVNDYGLAACHDALTGEEVWKEPLSREGFTASPILVDGKIYAIAKDGAVYVFEAATKFKPLATNTVGETVSSTPAVADNRLFIRGEKHLFCIGKATAQGASRGR